METKTTSLSLKSRIGEVNCTARIYESQSQEMVIRDPSLGGLTARKPRLIVAWRPSLCSTLLSFCSVFSRMRSEGFLFLSGGSGGGTVFVPISGLRPRAFASVRERPFCARCAVPLGLASRGRLGEALWRRAVVIAGESLVWVALCRCDCWGEPCLGGAVPL